MAAKMRRERLAHRVSKVFRVQRVVPEVPQACPQFAPARCEDALCRVRLAGIQLHGRAGEYLRNRIVDVCCKTCTLGCLEFRERTCGTLVEKFATSLLGKLPQFAVPEEDRRDDDDEKSYDDG